ncbi:flavin reductase family protein [Maricurvus nonylphenolicus]|uniref:flavin reductase family protein n=1 Tax=Maricurvus nonylphenolicus TaxID=1008307 RepID=UPI0036F3C1F2
MKEVDMATAMKEGMRRLASGVCIVSAQADSGERTAMTATSITSVSDSPASLLVCINRDTSMHSILSKGGDFAVNLLHNHQQELSNHCASGDQGEQRFGIGQWQESEGTPYLDDCLAVFICKQAQTVTFGTHDIVIGEIAHVKVADDENIDPLLYLNGGYHSIG